VDFGLTAPAPNSVTVAPGNTSGPVSFQVTAVGAFNSAVSLACSGLPAGAAYSFQPAGPVNPVSGVPVAVTMALNTSAITPTGSFPILIVGSTAGGPSRSQNLSLVVNTATSADYTINISNSPQTAGVTGNATFNGTLIIRERIFQFGDFELRKRRACDVYARSWERHAHCGRGCVYGERQQRCGAELQLQYSCYRK